MKTNITTAPKHLLRLSLLLFMAWFATSCSITTTTRRTAYPKMYEEKPTSILIMPPINETNHVEAKEYFYSSLAQPLAERGYYVFSPFLSMELLQQESANDAELFLDGSMKPFLNVFGTDAVLFTRIKKWEKASLLSQMYVEVEYILKSAKTDEIIFQRSANVTVDLSVNSGNGLVDLVAGMISTAVTDKIIAARKANRFILADMPFGKYSPEFGKDGDTPAREKHIVAVVR
ncbi:MAG: DUF799 family lipoprotein [Porphyromonas sp.]|nr:DUF799 family lipoprotein [Porphyromonas sp.]